MSFDSLPPYGCVFVGCLLVVYGVYLLKRLADSISWPKTNGVILESTVQSEWAGAGGSRIFVVCPKVTYEYQVEGKKYTSSQLALIERNSADENLARRKAEKYSPGQQVEVFYNPRKPGFAVLAVGDPTGGKLPYGMIIIGIGLTITGAIWIWARQH
jgi:Protein of unknown function (DUF3592)